MAGETQCTIFCDEKILNLGDVRGMTGETSLTADHRGMLERDILALLFMTIKTESIHPFQLKLWVLGSMGIMAG